MKKILSKIAIASALFLGACSNDAPDIQAGNGGLKYVVSSNVLNSEKETMVLDRESPIVFVMNDSLSQVTVSMSNGGALVPVRVRQSRDSVIVTSSTGTWDALQYNLSLVGSFKNGVGVSFDLSISREPGLNLVSSNAFDVANNTGYLQVPVTVGTLNYVFDQAVTTVELAKVYKGFIAAGNEVASTSSMAGDTLKLALGVDSLEFNNTYVVTFRVRSATGNWVDKTGGLVFTTATSSFLAVGSNVEVVGTAVGKPTFDFPLQGAITVEFSEAIDTDVRRLIWAASASTTFDLGNSKGTVAGGLIEANVAISGNTLTVTPVLPLTGVSNGNSVGFRVTVQSLRDRYLNTTVEVKATLRDNKLYVVSTNVVDSLGYYRPFKSFGDSLVVSFSKASKPETFKVIGFTTGYTVSWSADSLVATIKNLDTLTLATYGAVNPYETSAGTCTYGCGGAPITFSAVAADDGKTYTVGFSGYALQVHSEYEMVVVGSNILDQHPDNTIKVVAGEHVKDSLNAASSITVSFNRAVDTTKIKNAKESDKYLWIDYVEAISGNLIRIPATLEFSADARTVTINPVADLAALHANASIIDYSVHAAAVPALNLQSTKTASGVAAANKIVTAAFNVKFTPVNISALAMTIRKDTTHVVGGVNYKSHYDSLSVGFTSAAFTGAAGAPTLRVLVMQPALSADTVSYYQYRARNTLRNGTVGGWVYSTTTYVPTKRATLVDNAATLLTKSYEAIDITLENTLKVWDKDDDGTAYLNGFKFFNDGAVMEVQMRAVKDYDNDGVMDATDSYGPWSNSISFVDNIAPCDAKYNPTSNATVALTIPRPGLNRTGVDNSNATLEYTFTFPEDMDVTTLPAVSFYWASAATTTAKPVVDANASSWTDARHYVARYTLIAGTDYSTLAYWKGSIAGMKDASGVSVVTSGSSNLADGVAETVATYGSSRLNATAF